MSKKLYEESSIQDIATAGGNMYTIQISVRDKIATQTDDTVIINGNSDYSIEFDFDAEWADLNNKIGIFAYPDAAAHKWAYQPVIFSGNTCTVPILRDIHCVYVGVTAGNVRVTTPARVQCRLSISDYADTEEPPSADVWGQILAKLDELQTEIDEIKAGGVGGTDISLGVTGATVGQTVKVKAVDADGKPTAWEAVNMAAGADGITPTIGENGNWYLGETDTGKPSRGEKGDKGDTGAKGDKGDTGADGADGKSAYQYAQDGGYTGTETEFAEKMAEEQLAGTTNELTPTQVYEAVSAGIPVKVQYTDSTYGLLSFTAFNVAESLNVIVSQTIAYFNSVYILAQLRGTKSNNRWGLNVTTLAQKTDIPTVLPNPNSINITIGDTLYSYNGSETVNVVIDDGTEVSY